MINKKLLSIMGKEKKYILFIIISKITLLLLNVGMIYSISNLVGNLILTGNYNSKLIFTLITIAFLQAILTYCISLFTNNLASNVKEKLRVKVFDKIYSYGTKYAKYFNIAEISQLAVNGVENLETYFSLFIPQLIYSLLAPIILFIFLFNINHQVAIVLLIMVPLIPLAIVFVQKLAKKVNSEYWGSYVDLSEIFVDFLEGLTTLIIYNADEDYNNELNKSAEKFRKNTMKVLGMQLNNITVLDVIAYGGMAISIVLTAYYYGLSLIDIKGVIVIILISSEFFLPLRLLGSFFHIAMNGMGAVDHLFKILEMPNDDLKKEKITRKDFDICLNNIDFSYDKKRKILNKIDMNFKFGTINYLVGKSGCGKSTIASIIMDSLEPNKGEVYYGEKTNIKNSEILKNCTLVNNYPYLFNATLRYNLQMGNEKISDERMWDILEILSLKEYFENKEGLDTLIDEKGNNFSGGQRQRIAIARAILKDSPVYIFDEATSNIDSESEDIIMELIKKMKKNKLIILISHRLKHASIADNIYYMQSGEIMESGSFEELIQKDGFFYNLYNTQLELENWGLE